MYDPTDPSAVVIYRWPASDPDAQAKAKFQRDANNAHVDAGKQPSRFFYEVGESEFQFDGIGTPPRPCHVVVRRDRPGMTTGERRALTVAQDVREALEAGRPQVELVYVTRIEYEDVLAAMRQDGHRIVVAESRGEAGGMIVVANAEDTAEFERAVWPGGIR